MPRKKKTDDEKMVEKEWEDVDLDTLEPTTLELDPALREMIRNRDTLQQMTLRVGKDQIEEAKRVASATNQKYQRVMRKWLAEGASRARNKRLHKAS